MSAEKFLAEVKGRLNVASYMESERLWLADVDAPRLVAMVELAIGRLRGHAESSLYDTEAKWATGVLAELDCIAGGEVG